MIQPVLVSYSALIMLLISVAVQAEETHAEGGGFPPFDTATFAPTLFWLFITFGTLYWLMSRVALPRVSGIIETRNSTITRDVDQAAALQKKAEEAGVAYEAALAKAKANAVMIGQQAKDAASLQAMESRKKVETDMAAKIAVAEAKIADTKAKAMSSVSAIATDAASAIIERLTGAVPSSDAIAKAVSASLKS